MTTAVVDIKGSIMFLSSVDTLAIRIPTLGCSIVDVVKLPSAANSPISNGYNICIKPTIFSIPSLATDIIFIRFWTINIIALL